jgi:hypothetical protein
MKKRKKRAAGELRSEYKRSDFGMLVRGKYIDRLQTSSNVVVLAPELADVFPNAASVNSALHSLAEIARRARASVWIGGEQDSQQQPRRTNRRHD